MKNFKKHILFILVFLVSFSHQAFGVSTDNQLIVKKSKKQKTIVKKPSSPQKLSSPRKRGSTVNPFKILKKYSDTSEPFSVEILAENLGIVWGMVFISGKEILFTQRKGRIGKLNAQTGKVQFISGAPRVYARGQGGLLDVALHPQFLKNRKVYLSYSKVKNKKQTTAIAVGVLKGNKLTQLKDIFIAQPFISASRHFGSRLAFSKKGFLYVTVGDRTERHLAQKMDNHFGKVLRLTQKGKAPTDNPFVSVKGALPEIWSLGHRNPQGLFITKDTDEIWEQEHGPKGGDEINLIKKGRNYGWPVITYGREYWGPKIGRYKKKGMEQPIKYYTPSIAPCGLLIYSGKIFKKWKNNFFSGALVLKHLNRLEIIKKKVKEEERLLSDLELRVRHVIEGPKGFIYISVDQGKVLRLKP